MVKQISISNHLADQLDYYRNKWSASYSTVIKRFMKSTNEAEIYNRIVVDQFADLQSSLPKSMFYKLEQIKAIVIMLLRLEDEQYSNIVIDQINEAITNSKRMLTENQSEEIIK